MIRNSCGCWFIFFFHCAHNTFWFPLVRHIFSSFESQVRASWCESPMFARWKWFVFFLHVPNPFVWRRILKQSTFTVKYHLKSSILNEHGLDENGCRLFILLQWMLRMWSTRPRIQSRRHNIICIDIHFELQTVCSAHRTQRHIVVICK